MMILRKKSTLPFIFLYGGMVLFWLQACSTIQPPARRVGYPRPYRVMGKWYQPQPDATGFKQRGIASWYGRKFQGKKTSSGEIYNMYAMTAAHKTLPLGTYVKVKNLVNQRQIVVRINDRGPFVRNRIIDLSYTAAKKIGVVGPGTASVEIVALGRRAPSTASAGSAQAYIPVDYYTGKFTIQVGAFKTRTNAERLVRKLDRKYKYAHMKTYDSGEGIYYRVRVGLATTLATARKYEQMLIQDGYPEATITAE